MHNEILESQKYQEIIFRADRTDGKVSATGTSSVQLHGSFLLHGTEHELTVPVQEEITGGQWKGTAKFTVPYISWGLKSPNSFLFEGGSDCGGRVAAQRCDKTGSGKLIWLNGISSDLLRSYLFQFLHAVCHEISFVA